MPCAPRPRISVEVPRSIRSRIGHMPCSTGHREGAVRAPTIDDRSSVPDVPLPEDDRRQIALLTTAGGLLEDALSDAASLYGKTTGVLRSLGWPVNYMEE